MNRLILDTLTVDQSTVKNLQQNKENILFSTAY